MAARQWTESQKAKQRELIQLWQPWKQSTGAKTLEGKARVSQNALKHGEYTAASLQAEREHRESMRQHHQVFNDFINASQEYLDLVSQHQYEEMLEGIMSK